MKFLKSTIAAAAMVGTLAVTPARADFIFTNQCGGQSFSTCASGSLTAVTGGGVTTVTINITHEGTNGELFKAVGIIGLPAGSTVAFVSGPTGYAGPPPNDLSGGGLPNEQFGASAQSQSDMLGLGDSGTFVFTIQGELTQQQIDALGVGVHAISGPNGCSNKYGVVGGTVVDNAESERYAECGETVIPEPITMTLLATGLAGMGGAGFLRRKKDEEIG